MDSRGECREEVNGNLVVPCLLNVMMKKKKFFVLLFVYYGWGA